MWFAGNGEFSVTVSKISEVSLRGYLTVDPASMSALQIFQDEEHPSAMGIGTYASLVNSSVSKGLALFSKQGDINLHANILIQVYWGCS